MNFILWALGINLVRVGKNEFYTLGTGYKFRRVGQTLNCILWALGMNLVRWDKIEFYTLGTGYTFVPVGQAEFYTLGTGYKFRRVGQHLHFILRAVCINLVQWDKIEFYVLGHWV